MRELTQRAFARDGAEYESFTVGLTFVAIGLIAAFPILPIIGGIGVAAGLLTQQMVINVAGYVFIAGLTLGCAYMVSMGAYRVYFRHTRGYTPSV